MTEQNNDTNRTAADEAKDIQKDQKPRVRVSCSLAQGIVMNNHLDRDGRPTGAANTGPGVPVEVKGVTEVDKDFYDAWAEHNRDFIDRGVISAVPVEEIERNEAEKRDGEENLGREGKGRSEPDIE